MSIIIEKILEILQAQAESAADIIDIMTSSRPVSYRKARRSLLHGAPEFKHDWSNMYREHQRFYSMLSYLRKQGLVCKKKSTKNSAWKITKKGINKLIKLKEKSTTEKMKLHNRRYDAKDSNNMILVAFDVPEKEKRKRNWLRSALVSLRFSQLQKSLWVGKIQIPEEFIKDLRDYRILEYVHIFSVNLEGTMHKITLEK